MSTECRVAKPTRFFSPEELALIHEKEIPHHVAIIMDGNRRWAKQQALLTLKNPFRGHWKGARVLLEVVEAAAELGIQVLTAFGFSTENWARPKTEIETLFKIIGFYLKENREQMCEQGVRFHVIGDLSPFPSSLKKEITETCEATRKGSEIDLVVALNYGGRSEVVRAVRTLVAAVTSGRLTQGEITEEMVENYLDTAPFGDPDLLIRTSGETRLSNFLLWQLAYTEILITDVLWPDFTSRDLFNAVLTYQERERRLGQ